MGSSFSFTVSAAAREAINSRSNPAFKSPVFQKSLMVTGLVFQLIAEAFAPIAEPASALPLISRDARAGVTARGVGELALESRGERKSVAPFQLDSGAGERGNTSCARFASSAA
jgi:hypothetical protein